MKLSEKSRKSKEQIDQIIKLYSDGWSMTKIMEKLKIDRHTISNYLKYNNITVRAPSYYRYGSKLSKDHIAKLQAGKKLSPYKPAANRKPLKEIIFANIERSAKTRNHKIFLTVDEVELLSFKNCFYCNSKPSKIPRYRQNVKINGIDRIDSKKDYTKDNVVTCCSICNTMKNTYLSEEFLEQVIKIYINFFKKNKQ